MPGAKSYNYPVDAVLLLGPTGAGKSPLGDVMENYGFTGRPSHHLDFGSELRAAVTLKTRSKFYSRDELDFIRGVLERGLLLENEHAPLAEKIITLFLDRAGFTHHSLIILNGIPRHIGQARDMSRLFHIHALIVLDCSAAVVLSRIRDNAGGDRTERTDDEQGLIEKKLLLFSERTVPLVDYYAALGRSVYHIAVTGTMTAHDAYHKLLSLAAAYPPVTLVVEPPQ